MTKIAIRAIRSGEPTPITLNVSPELALCIQDGLFSDAFSVCSDSECFSDGCARARARGRRPRQKDSGRLWHGA